MAEIPDDLKRTLEKQDQLYANFYLIARWVDNNQLTALSGIVSKYMTAAHTAAEGGIDCRENRVPLEDYEVEYLNEKLQMLFKDVMLVRPSHIAGTTSLVVPSPIILNGSS